MFPLLSAMAAPDAVTLLSGACTVLSGTVAFLWNENRRLQRDLVAVYRERDTQRDQDAREREAQRERDAETWREAVGHLEAIREQTSRGRRP